MPVGIRTPDELKLDIMELVEKGVPASTIAKDLHTSQSTVYRVKKEFENPKENAVETIIAGDKTNGTLTAVGPDHYFGTCKSKNGKMKRRHFHARGSSEAIKQWEDWCNDIRQGNAAPKIQEKPKAPEASNALTGSNRIYLLAVGAPKISDVFTDYEEAQKAMEIANRALEFAGVDVRYSICSFEL